MARHKRDHDDSTSMKPKNRVMCPDSMKQKMLFESERKANDFIKWNGGEIDTHGGVLRAYYCPACCGWHISSRRYNKDYETRTDRLINAYNKSIKTTNKKIDRLIHSIDYENEARKVFADLPAKIQLCDSRNVLRKYLTEYFKNHGIIDNGDLRTAIYKVWEQYVKDPY